MNREVKFRIWYPQYKSMGIVRGYLWEEMGLNKENLADFSPGKEVLMQYTGLKDKNNKEIYEGDIVRVDPKHPSITFSLNAKHLIKYSKANVMWSQFRWCIGQKYLGSIELSEFAMCDCCPCGLEIIGNVFENPELLK